MNQAQTKYALARAKDIYDYKSKKIHEQTETPQVRLNGQEIFEAVKRGEYSIKSNCGSAYYVRDLFEFPAERLAVVDTKRRTELLEQLRIAYGSLTDELMLGDCEQALKLLKEFEAIG